jgi:hypothetical protein
MAVGITITTSQWQTLTGKKSDVLKNLQEHLSVGRFLFLMLLA